MSREHIEHTDKLDRLSLLSAKAKISSNPDTDIQCELTQSEGEFYLAENVCTACTVIRAMNINSMHQLTIA